MECAVEAEKNKEGGKRERRTRSRSGSNHGKRMNGRVGGVVRREVHMTAVVGRGGFKKAHARSGQAQASASARVWSRGLQDGPCLARLAPISDR